MRFNANNHRSLNESIARVQNPQAALDEALEYTAALESIILSICEELEIDPDELMEDMAYTAAREKELDSRISKLFTRSPDSKVAKKVDALAARHNRERDSNKYLYSKGGKRRLIPKKGTASRARFDKKVKVGKILTRGNY